MQRTGEQTTDGRTTADVFRHELLAEVERAVDERLRDAAGRGVAAGDLGDPVELAHRMVSAIPRPAHPLDVELGPFYDTAGLCDWWGVSRQALADRVRRGRLLACRTDDGHLVYPALQFSREGAVRPGLLEVIGVMARANVDGWTAAVWMTTPSPVLDGESAVDHLVVHRASTAAVARVVRQAEADAATWAS